MDWAEIKVRDTLKEGYSFLLYITRKTKFLTDTLKIQIWAVRIVKINKNFIKKKGKKNAEFNHT